MLTEQGKLDGVVNAIQSYVPGFSLKLKSKSKLQKFIGKIAAIWRNKSYMDLYWTTIGKTVYRPTMCDNGPAEGEWQVMLHEGRHVDDCYKLGPILYNFLYLFPQIIGILGILYTLVILPVVLLGEPLGLLWGVLSLLCLTPFPSLPRALIESRGYAVTMAVAFWTNSVSNWEEYIKELTNHFVNSDYYYMWPYKTFITRYFNGILEDLKTGCPDMDPYLIMCRSKCFSYKQSLQ